MQYIKNPAQVRNCFGLTHLLDKACKCNKSDVNICKSHSVFSAA